MASIFSRLFECIICNESKVRCTGRLECVFVVTPGIFSDIEFQNGTRIGCVDNTKRTVSRDYG